MSKDELVKELYQTVQEKKAAIAKAEKPKWETNCSFRYEKNSSNSSAINIQVCSDVEELADILGHLIVKKNAFDEAQKILGTSVKFRWAGFTFDEWAADIKTRVDKIEVTNNKKLLEVLEARLNKLEISKEMREQMELEDIKLLLGK